MSLKLLQNSQENIFVGVSFLPQTWDFIEKGTPTYVFSYEFLEFVELKGKQK